MARKTAALLATVLFLGCSPQPVHIDRESQEGAVPAKSEDERQGRCRFHLVSIHDGRFSKQEIGLVGHQHVTDHNVIAWIRGAFEAAGFHASRPKSPHVSVRIELKRAYIKSQSMSKSSHIVLGVRFGPPETAGPDEYFRGDDTSLYWASGTTEIRNSLNRALEEVIAKITSAAMDHCASVAGYGTATSNGSQQAGEPGAVSAPQ